ncbi:MAG: dihydrolipoyl dehydrogenase [Eubacteriales bacterium]|nr:dihydrolipoyl dehydrogenase [Eubacteriales bacterium]MDD3866418.1 dihydrolipoyl dehydrogenase [Eubacteriales bacterium]MDD4461304.1 dihydrolipoyl dehydrogenase [Eubacteriales bacterium]
MFDLIVLGGGPGGYLAAERAGQAGLAVLLIEKDKLGGVCLNEGCIPSKTLLNGAKIYEYALHGKAYGVTVESARYDPAVAVKRKNKVVRGLVAGIKQQLKQHGVVVVSGEGRIISREPGRITVQAGNEQYSSRWLIIATGSEPVIPPITGIQEGLESGFVLTSREMLDLEQIPEQLVVIGGGVIGLEMASLYQSIGSQVAIVEMLDQLAGQADREQVGLLQRQLEKKGMQVFLQSRVSRVSGDGVEFQQDGETKWLNAEKILLSVGRRPRIRGIGLENIGVYTEKGRIVTDEQGRTNWPDVYAVGDVNGLWMLAHAAYREAEVAIASILGENDRMSYDAMPSVIYTQPELASVGLTADACREKGIPYLEVRLPMQYSGRFMAENAQAGGQIHLLVHPRRQILLGCHLLGSYASEIILTAGMMIEHQMPLSEIKKFIFPHPTVAEIIREAVFRLPETGTPAGDQPTDEHDSITGGKV